MRVFPGYFGGVLTRRFSIKTKMNIREIEGDLFGAPKDESLAHCVAADMRLGAGIAVKFRNIFGQIDHLKSQKVKPGGVAVLKDNNRYIYYMVTKELSRGKPTYFTLNESLHSMKEHMIRANVTKVAMPRIGCGLDGLEWEKVKEMLVDVFKDQNIDVTVYNFVPK